MTNNYYNQDFTLDFLTEGLDDGSSFQKDMEGPCWLPLDDMIDVTNYQGDGFDLDLLRKQTSQEDQFWGDLIKIEGPSEPIQIKQEEATAESNINYDSESLNNSQTGPNSEDQLGSGEYFGIDHKSKNIKKKRRLKGNDLISSIQHDPVFSQHRELLDKRLDDSGRKRMMQKIRNRISAQESRDRRKLYIDQMIAENRELAQENLTLREMVSQLKTKNESLMQKCEELSTTKEGSSIENRSEHDSTPPTEGIDEPQIFRQKLPSPGMDWKVGTLFVIGLVCASAMMPANFQSNIKDVKQNAIVPLLTGRRPVNLHENTQAFSKVQDICKPFCKQQCRTNEEIHYKEYYETARQVHKIIPSLHGIANNQNQKANRADDNEDVAAYLNFENDNSQDSPNASYSMGDRIENEQNLYQNNSTGLVQRFEQFQKPQVRTLLCNSAVEVRDELDERVPKESYFKDGQIINLIIPKNKIQEISAEPSSQGERVRQNKDATGYLALMAEIQTSQEFEGSQKKISQV